MASPRPERRKITDDELVAWREQGLSFAQIRRKLEEAGRPTLTVAGLSYRWKQIQERREDEGNRILPWRIDAAHSQNWWIYSAVLAYGKMRQGRGLSDTERRLAREFEEKIGASQVMYYSPSEGFMLRRREPGDGPSLLVKE